MNGLFELSLSFSENKIEQFGWVLIHSIWQFTLVALLAAVVIRLMNRRSSNARHAVLVGLMAISILLPIGTWIALSSRTAEIAQSPSFEIEQFAPTPAPSVPHTIVESKRSETTFSGSQINTAVPISETQPLPAETTRTTSPSVNWTDETVTGLHHWLSRLVALWAVGVVLCSFRPILGWITLRRLKTVGISTASKSVLVSMSLVSQRLGFTRSVEVLESRLAQVPMVVGYFRPVILLPFCLVTSIPIEQLEAILAHELAHIRRHDFVINMLQILVETVFFYHPAVWWLSNRVRIEREHCCDDLVVKVMDNRSDDGRALIAIEVLRGRGPVLSLSASDGSLIHRIRRITGMVQQRNSFAAWTSTCLVAGLAGAGVILSMASNNDAMAMNEVPGDAIIASVVPTILPIQDDHDIFENLEPGVRLLGKPAPSAILGAVLDFLSIEGGQKIIAVCEDGIKLWDTEQNKILKMIEFETRISVCNSLKQSHNRNMIAISTWSFNDPDPNQPGVVWVVDKDLNQQAKFLLDTEPSEIDDQFSAGTNNLALAIEFSDDDAHLALATSKSFHWCEIESGDFVKTHEFAIAKNHSNLIIEKDRILGLGFHSYQLDRKNGKLTRLPDYLKELNKIHLSIFHKDSKRIFAAKQGKQSELIIFDLDDDSVERIEFPPHTRFLNMKLSADASLWAVTSLQSQSKSFQIGVYDSQSRGLKHRFSLTSTFPETFEFSPDRKSLKVAPRFGAGLQKLVIEPGLVEQNASLTPSLRLRNVLLSGDGSKLLGCLVSSQAVKWDWTTGESEESNEMMSTVLPTSSNDDFFYLNQKGIQFSIKKGRWSNDKNKTIQTYSIRRQLAMSALGYLTGFGNQADTKSYYVLPSSVAIDEANNELHCVVIDTLDGIRVQTVSLPNSKVTSRTLFKRPKNSDLAALPPTAITANGKRLAIFEDEKLKVIEVESKEVLFEQASSKVGRLMFSKNHDWLAIQTSKSIKIVSPDSGEVFKVIKEPDALFAYAFNGKKLLVASPKKGGAVRIFSTTNWELELAHKTKTANRVSVSISNDGRRAAFALDNGRIELWNLERLAR